MQAESTNDAPERPTAEQIAAMPLFALPAGMPVRIWDAGPNFRNVLERFRHAGVVGFDTETRDTQWYGPASDGPDLVQFATDQELLLVRTASKHAWDLIRAVLEEPAIRKVGFGLNNDRRALARKQEIALHHYVELTKAIRPFGYRQAVGLRAAVAIFLGQRLAKPMKVTRSNWGKTQLTHAQVRYAAEDALASLLVYRAIGSPEPMSTSRRSDKAQPVGLGLG